MGISLDWSVLRGLPSVGDQFSKGMAEGRDQYRQGVQDNALAGLARNPKDAEAMSQLAGVSPDAAWKMQDRKIALDKNQRAEQAALLVANRDNILKGAQIVRQVNPTDQASWNQVLSIAKRSGIPLTPEWNEYNPELVKGLIAQADVFEPQKGAESDIQFLTPTDGGVYAGNKRTGAISPVIVPNDGTKPAGEAARPPANGIPVVSDAAGYNALPPGTEYKDPSGNVRVKPGGPTKSSSGRFPDPLAPL